VSGGAADALAGKTMLAKAVAHHTTAAFIRVVGSEFVQKYLGEVSTQI
jgi:26S proteasome regulatory subunit T3